MGQHLDAATAPTAGLAWTFTGNEQAIVKVTVDEGALTQARWGVFFRSDEKITSFSRGSTMTISSTPDWSWDRTTCTN